VTSGSHLSSLQSTVDAEYPPYQHKTPVSALVSNFYLFQNFFSIYDLW